MPAVITQVIVLHQAAGHSLDGRTPPAGAGGVLSLGLELDGGRRVWVACNAPADFAEPEAREEMAQTLAAALSGRALPSSLPALCAHLQALSRVGNAARVADSHDTGISRRAFLTGRLFASSQRPETPAQAVPTALHPAICYGASLALLAARAELHGHTVAQALAQAFDLAPPDKPPGLLAYIDGDAAGNLPMLPAQLAAVGYRVPAGDAAQVLGEDCHILQRFTRMLREQMLAHYGPVEPAIHLDLCGQLDRLYDAGSGKMLGAIYGLERAAHPLVLRLEGLVATAPEGVASAHLNELATFIRLRGLKVELVADVTGPEQVEAAAAARAVTWARFRPQQLGTCDQSIRMIAACRVAGLRPLLDLGEGVAVESLPLGVQAATALAPDLLGTPASAAGLAARELARLALRL